MFDKVKITNNANSFLNLVETKFYEVVLAPPCLSLFLETLISRAISRRYLFASIALYAGAHSAFRLYEVLVKHV